MSQKLRRFDGTEVDIDSLPRFSAGQKKKWSRNAAILPEARPDERPPKRERPTAPVTPPVTYAVHVATEAQHKVYRTGADLSHALILAHQEIETLKRMGFTVTPSLAGESRKTPHAWNATHPVSGALVAIDIEASTQDQREGRS